MHETRAPGRPAGGAAMTTSDDGGDAVAAASRQQHQHDHHHCYHVCHNNDRSCGRRRRAAIDVGRRPRRTGGREEPCRWRGKYRSDRCGPPAPRSFAGRRQQTLYRSRGNSTGVHIPRFFFRPSSVLSVAGACGVVFGARVRPLRVLQPFGTMFVRVGN